MLKQDPLKYSIFASFTFKYCIFNPFFTFKRVENGSFYGIIILTYIRKKTADFHPQKG